MPFSIIVAMDLYDGIGKDNQLPWHIKQDLQYFKNKTLNKTIIMGSNTYFSLPNRPLKYRKNIVLTTDKDKKDIIEKDGAIVYDNINDIINDFKNEDCFIIGGASIYKQFIDYCDTLYITKVAGQYDCDTFFPYFDKLEWFVESYGNWNEKDFYVFSFQSFNRIKDYNDIKYIYNIYISKFTDTVHHSLSMFKGSDDYYKVLSYIRKEKLKKIMKFKC